MLFANKPRLTGNALLHRATPPSIEPRLPETCRGSLCNCCSFLLLLLFLFILIQQEKVSCRDGSSWSTFLKSFPQSWLDQRGTRESCLWSSLSNSYDMEYPAPVEQSVSSQSSTLISSAPVEREGFTERHQIANKESMGEVDYESLPTDKLWAHLLAGGAAGVTEHCVMYPVDCVKTRMMALVPNPNANYNNLFGAFKTILKTERPSVLFRGITVVATGAGPAHALYFSMYEFSKRWFSRHYNSIMSQGGAAALATLLHDGCMNPIEVIKQRLQMYKTPYRGVIHCGVTILRQEGLHAFYRSYTTQLSMNIPFQVLHFIGYEFLQDMLNPSRSYDPLSHMISGGGAGAIAAAFTTPLDVARTFLNTHEQRKILASDERLYGMMNTLVRIYRVKGVRGYFRGLSARVIYQVPSTALCWSVYEMFKYGLGLKEEFVETTPTVVGRR